MSAGRHVREELADVLLGEVEQGRTPEVERHLKDCAECASALSRLQGVKQLVTEAPLDPSPPAGLRDDVFLQVDHARTTALLEQAPLGPDPDGAMAARVFSDDRLDDKVVPLDARREVNASRARLGVILGTAAVLVAALVFSLVQVADLNDQVKDLESDQVSGVPQGHDMQTVRVAGAGFDSRMQLVHFRHDNYRLELLAEDFPAQKHEHHYEVMLKGPGGEINAGSFRIRRPDEVTFVFNVGIDPATYNQVEIVEEPDLGWLPAEGDVIARGEIDPTRVEHD